jgi:hypothetical protein
MSASDVVMLLGWFFLMLNFVWSKVKWGGIITKIALSALSIGLFLANAIHAFLS